MQPPPSTPRPPPGSQAANSSVAAGLHTVLRALLIVALIAALVLLIARQPPATGIEVERRDPLPGVDQIRVNVSGAVASPAVMTAHPGDRVGDVIERAGGTTAGADLAAINLARRVTDEDHIHVPRRGEMSHLIDLNSATPQELQTLPGIGPVRAAAIIAAREAQPFASTDELVERRILSVGVYEGLRDLIATPGSDP